MQGTITIYNTPTLLLFDKGYIHSYMSHRLVRELSLKPRNLDPPLNVSTSNGNQTLVDNQGGPVLMKVQHKYGIGICYLSLGEDRCDFRNRLVIEESYHYIDYNKKKVYLDRDIALSKKLFLWGK